MDKAVLDLVRRALAEDVGSGDVTTRATVPPGATATAVITQKAPGVVFGLDVAAMVFRELDSEIAFTPEVEEGLWRDDGGLVATIEGHAGSILTAERTALNFIGRLSGVATRRRGPCARWRGPAPGSSTPARPSPGCARWRRRRCPRAGGPTTVSASTTR